MAITSNVTINEGQVIFKRTSGHTHDGLLSSLIDTKKYSMFDFVPAPLSSDPTRVAFQENNRNIFKSFIISTIEERVLNPKGIRIQANAITANEIATATITANELVRDFIMVNNTMRSNTFNGTVDKNGNITYEGGTGWAISHTGKTVFNDVTIRGTIISTSGNIGGWTINNNTITAGNTILRSNGYLKIANGDFTGTITAGNGTIASFSIDSTILKGSSIDTDSITYYVTSETSMSKYELKSNSVYDDYINDYKFYTSAYIRGDMLYPGLYVTRQTYSLSGNYYVSSSGYSYTSSGPLSISDIRIKNIYDEDCNALAMINNLDLIVYSLKNDTTNEKKLGFSAQQAYNIVPNFSIPGGEDPEKQPWQIVKESLIPYLTKSIQQLSEKVDYLEARVQTLEGV
jgi:hypothetical protein